MAPRDRVVRLLQPFAEPIAQQGTRQQIERFTPSSWLRRFPQDEVVQGMVETYSGSLTRDDIHSLGRAALKDAKESAAKRFFLGVMMWGWGPRGGRGPRFAASALGDERFSISIRAMLASLESRDIASAYAALRLKGVGAAYLTKLLYFAGIPAYNGPGYPLILDSYVARTLALLLGSTIDDRYTPIDYMTGYWYEGYSTYCADMHHWAAALGCEADDIEFFLWKAANPQLPAPSEPYNQLVVDARRRYEAL